MVSLHTCSISSVVGYITWHAIAFLRSTRAFLHGILQVQKIFQLNELMNSCMIFYKYKNHSELGCRDGVHQAKNHGNKEVSLAILSIMHNHA